MKIKKRPPNEGKCDGEIYLSGLSSEEYEAAVEEIIMIQEMLERLDESMKQSKEVKDKVDGYWRGV